MDKSVRWMKCLVRYIGQLLSWGPPGGGGTNWGWMAGLTKPLFLQDSYEVADTWTARLMATRVKMAMREPHLCGIGPPKRIFFFPGHGEALRFEKNTFSASLGDSRQKKSFFLLYTVWLWIRVRSFWPHLPGMDGHQKTAF